MDTDFEAHPYLHNVQYYETDKMAVTHHSNYIRWMEEARVDFLERLGCGFDRMEEKGVGSPVLEVRCRYRRTTTFADTVAVIVRPRMPGDFKLWLDYTILLLKKQKESSDNAHDAKGTASISSDSKDSFDASNAQIAATGSTCHCFLDGNGKPVRLADSFPDLYKAIVALVKE